MKLSPSQLDEFWQKINDGKFDNLSHKPERIHAEDGRDIMSIPNENTSARCIYERKNGGVWQEVPFIGVANA
jgi:hypothetical protein